MDRHIVPKRWKLSKTGIHGKGNIFSQYKRLKNVFEGVLTGKGLDWGGSLLRPEATGFGAVYFAEEMLKTVGETIDGKIIAVSGFGNVAWGVVKKATEMGGKVVTLSGPDGFINCLEAAERSGARGNYFAGANVAGFIKVANAMIDQGNA